MQPKIEFVDCQECSQSLWYSSNLIVGLRELDGTHRYLGALDLVFNQGGGEACIVHLTLDGYRRRLGNEESIGIYENMGT